MIQDAKGDAWLRKGFDCVGKRLILKINVYIALVLLNGNDSVCMGTWRRIRPPDAYGAAGTSTSHKGASCCLGRKDQVSEYNGPSTGTPVRQTTYSYDPISGQISQIASPEGTINYAYDPATGRQTRTYTGDNDTSYEYDDQGRLWQVTVSKLNGQAVSLATTYTCDAVGTADDELITYNYNERDQLTTETSSLNGATTYDYDANGSTISVTSSAGTQKYVWDLRSRMIGDAGPTHPTAADSSAT